MAKDSDEAADRPWNGDKAGWVEAEKLLDRKIYDQLLPQIAVTVRHNSDLDSNGGTSPEAIIALRRVPH